MRISYRVACTRCGREHDESFDNAQEARHYAKIDGWVYRKVQNGSYWDFCPRCKDREEQ